MLSKRKLKVFKSLQIKKYRQQERMFLVEGAKGLEETLKSNLKIAHLLITKEFEANLNFDASKVEEIEIVKESDLIAVGTFSSNNAGAAVVHMPAVEEAVPNAGLIVALDSVRDPGNLGTIIRVCDWYGIQDILCSKDTADLYNPKVINSTMGSFTRVNLQYVDLEQILSDSKLPIYGALLEGENIYKEPLEGHAIVVMGNESKGISDPIKALVNRPISIPRKGGAESLNVAIATAVVLDNFVR